MARVSVPGSAVRERRVHVGVKTMRYGLVVMLAVGLLSACAAGSSGGGDGGLEDLDGRSFVSTAVTDAGAARPLVAGTQIRLDFADGVLGAGAGCNSMSGPYRLDGDTLTMPEGLATTEIGCEPALMDQDAWLAQLLLDQPTLRVAGDVLTVTGGTTVVTLQDRETAEPQPPVVGTAWVLDGIIDGETVSSVPAGVTASLQIEEQPDGSLRALVADGCNRGNGTVTVDEQTMTFGVRATTLMACAEAQEEVAIVVNSVLTGTVGYEAADATLTITSPERGLVFRADG